MRLIVGLGNPGKQYQNNRHNIGFNIVDSLLEDYPNKTKVNVPALIGDLERLDPNLLALKPTSYMNHSGIEVAKVVNFFKITPSDILVIQDEVDIPFGTIKLHFGKSSAGHRGVESIIESLGTQDFHRLRVGVSRPPENIPTDQYVLQDFSSEEASQLKNITSEALIQIKSWI